MSLRWVGARRRHDAGLKRQATTPARRRHDAGTTPARRRSKKAGHDLGLADGMWRRALVLAFVDEACAVNPLTIRLAVNQLTILPGAVNPLTLLIT